MYAPPALGIVDLLFGYTAYKTYDAYKKAKAAQEAAAAAPPPPASGEPLYVPVNSPLPPPAPAQTQPMAPPASADPGAIKQAKAEIIAGVPNAALLIGAGALGLIVYALASDRR